MKPTHLHIVVYFYLTLCPLCKVILLLSTGLTGVLCITLPVFTQLWTTRTTSRCFLWICPRPPQCDAMRPVASPTGSLARLASCFERMRQDSSALLPIASSVRVDAPSAPLPLRFRQRSGCSLPPCHLLPSHAHARQDLHYRVNSTILQVQHAQHQARNRCVQSVVQPQALRRCVRVASSQALPCLLFVLVFQPFKSPPSDQNPLHTTKYQPASKSPLKPY